MTNIVKILENAPFGIRLYSPICGECTLEEVYDNYISVNNLSNEEVVFNNNGTYNSNGECLLWPSKERLSWAGWQTVLMRQDECLGTIVMSGTNSEYIITHDGFVLCENVNKCLDFACAPSIDIHFADIEESEKAMELLECNGYKWCEETETLEKIREEPLEVVPMMPEDEIEAVLENSPNRSEEKFKEDLKVLLIKHNMDQLMKISANIIVEYMTENLKNIHTLIQKRTQIVQ